MTRPAIALALGLAACRAAAPAPDAGPERLTLVETAPVETVLDHADLPETADVWRAMIAAARESVELAHFYASDRPGSRLAPVVAGLEDAAARGVRVRFLADAGFHATYPETLDRLAARPGIEVRLYDLRERTGGVLHAKLLIVDGRDVFVGSPNFDWRSLEHVQELGVRVESRSVAAAFQDVFALDWRLAGGGRGSAEPRAAASDFPTRIDLGGGDVVGVTPVFSPCGLLPDEGLWDLPRLVALVDGARSSVGVQLLTYRASARDGYFDPLEGALRRAAARGARVRLFVADWGKRAGTVEGLQSLAALDGVEVRFATLPPASEGFVPYARVIHAKLLVVDGERAWVGTSNWERGYFEASRNAGLVLEGGSPPRRLQAFFDDGWDGPYAYPVDPGARYEPPRVGE